jgi:hypothetical protein
VGLDVIGEHLTEVNVTSPTGIQELSRFVGVRGVAGGLAQRGGRAGDAVLFGGDADRLATVAVEVEATARVDGGEVVGLVRAGAGIEVAAVRHSGTRDAVRGEAGAVADGRARRIGADVHRSFVSRVAVLVEVTVAAERHPLVDGAVAVVVEVVADVLHRTDRARGVGAAVHAGLDARCARAGARTLSRRAGCADAALVDDRVAVVVDAVAELLRAGLDAVLHVVAVVAAVQREAADHGGVAARGVLEAVRVGVSRAPRVPRLQSSSRSSASQTSTFPGARRSSVSSQSSPVGTPRRSTQLASPKPSPSMSGARCVQTSSSTEQASVVHATPSSQSVTPGAQIPPVHVSVPLQ